MKEYSFKLYSIDGGLLLGDLRSRESDAEEAVTMLVGRKWGTTLIARIEIFEDGVLVRTEHAYHNEPCAACGEAVPLTEEAVWICPADLNKNNPYWQPADERITEELMEQHGVYAYCGEEFGFPCYEDFPLHEKCHDEGEY